MNYSKCVEEYGEVIAGYVAKRIEEDHGINGLDLFKDKGCNEFDVADYVEEIEDYYNQFNREP